MKYIRTESTIFKVLEEKEIVYIVQAKNDQTKSYSKSKSQTTILSSSDKLENLFDLYVIHYTFGKPVITRNKRKLKDYVSYLSYLTLEERRNLLSKYKCYGAIWTKNGLSYVAYIDEEIKWRLL